MLVYLAAGSAPYFWKEHVHHYVSGARSALLALHTTQGNYRNDHSEYADTFSELGVPMRARMQGDELTWDGGPYRFRIARIIRDHDGKVIHYTIEAHAEGSSGQRLPIMSVTD